MDEQIMRADEGGLTPRDRRPEQAPELATRTKALLVALLAAVALASFFLVARLVTSPQANAGAIAALDEKKATVTSLMGSSTASSAAISLLPGDAGTPLAEKLVDLSSDFLVVLAAIYLEKYLLAIMGYVSFKVLVPLACAFVAVGVLLQRELPVRAVLMHVGAKLALFGVVAYLVVPASVWVSGVIEDTYQASIDQTLATAEQTASDIEASVSAGDEAEGQASGGILQTLQQLPSTLTSTVTGLTEDAQASLNNFIDALAVMIVTSCVIPILVLLFFLWLANVLLGVNLSVPTRLMAPRALRRR